MELEDRGMMNTLIALTAALIIAAVGYSYFSKMEFSINNSASARMERFAVADRRGMADRLGDSIMDRFGFSIEAWEHELLWAQLGGFYQGRTTGSILGMSILYTGAGLAYILITQTTSPIFFLALAVAAYYPYLQLKGKAGEVRKTVQRGLPEAAALIAAEMAAGSSAETAITRAANLPGPLGRMIQDAVLIAQQAGRLIFSRDLIDGVLVEHFGKYRNTHIEAFARQIDLVASKGAEGPKQMGEVARGLSREYRSEVKSESEKLGNKLLLPMTLYVFIPFMLAIFVPLFASVFTSF
jgi:tight adherence protein C